MTEQVSNWFAGDMHVCSKCKESVPITTDGIHLYVDCCGVLQWIDMIDPVKEQAANQPNRKKVWLVKYSKHKDGPLFVCGDGPIVKSRAIKMGKELIKGGAYYVLVVRSCGVYSETRQRNEKAMEYEDGRYLVSPRQRIAI